MSSERTSATPLVEPDERATLSSRIMWLTGARLALVTALLGSTLFLKWGRAGGFSSNALVAFMVLSFAVSAVVAAMLQRARSLRALANLQLAWDLLFATGVVYITNGIESGFVFLHGIPPLVAAVTVGRDDTRTVSLASVALYAALGFALVNHLIPPPPDQPERNSPGDQLIVTVGLFRNFVALGLVGILATGLAGRLQRAGTEVREMREAAERAERLAALGRLAAGLAHEIRNPLSSISGSVQLVRESGTLSDEDERLLSIVLSEVSRLDELVRTMLVMGRPNPPVRVAIDCAALLHEVAVVAEKGEAAPREATVKVSVDGAVPATADPNQVRQVAWNLLRNALAVTPKGGCVTLSARRESAGAVIEVADEGPGVPLADRERIFDMFHSQRPQGTGLGLALVKQIVTAHGGVVSVEDREGGGAVFRAEFPD